MRLQNGKRAAALISTMLSAYKQTFANMAIRRPVASPALARQVQYPYAKPSRDRKVNLTKGF